MAREMTAVKRSYDASGRRRQAQERRHRVVLAAREQFERNGFRLATVAAIAERAQVSPETVYKTFGGKGAIAKAIFDLEVAGDDAPEPIADRREAQEVRDEPDLRRKIALFVEGLARRQSRSAWVHILIRDGRHVDDTLQAVWSALNDEAFTAATTLADLLVATGQVRPDMTPGDVRDSVWNYFAIDHYERLVLHRGWSLERYTSWLARTITDTVCA